jgi:outer membrane protein assembly factor BamB
MTDLRRIDARRRDLHVSRWTARLGTSTGRASVSIFGSLALLVFALLPSAHARQDEEPGPGDRAFHIYDTALARTLVEEAEDHLSAERWSEAISTLQTLLEDHRAEVLGATFPGRGPHISKRPVHVGAANWASTQLHILPPEGRTLYRQRYDKPATAALERALADLDLGALVEVARRWPLCEAAGQAWFALGDLELERGSVDMARNAWARALAHGLDLPSLPHTDNAWTTLLSGLADAAAVDVSLMPVLEGAQARNRQLSNRQHSEELNNNDTPFRTALGGALDVGKPVRPEQDAWPTPVGLPTNPLKDRRSRSEQNPYRLFAAREGQHLFVTTTREVLAIGAWTGELLWNSQPEIFGPHLPTWKQFVDSRRSRDQLARMIDDEQGLFAPAVSNGIVVAALQLPVEIDSEQDYRELEIMRVKPERRLFAFDSATGTKLWGHLPPKGWSGDGGNFAERTSVVGPPTIMGDRVLVPMARLAGRIEFHVGCFDLRTGAELWHTPVISGQREMNMFGRPLKEFSAPPIVVHGDRAIVLTQLGTLICLDLLTGTPEWETVYEQITMRPGYHYNASELDTVWHNAPPVIEDGAIVAAPEDSEHLIGVDLDTGAMVWSLRYAELSKRLGNLEANAIRRLVGVIGNRVYLEGTRMVCFQATGSLRRSAPSHVAWFHPDRSSRLAGQIGGWPVLTRDRVYVPSRNRITILESKSGRQVEEAFDLPQEATGNLLVGEDALFTLSPHRIMGWFEWKTMVSRAREAVRNNHDAPGPVRDLALVLMQAGISTRMRAKTPSVQAEANRYLRQARELLQENVERPGFELLAAPLYRVLREQATAARLAVDPRAAANTLKEALEFAPLALDRAETMLVLQEIQRTTDANARMDTLDQLLTDFPSMRFWCTIDGRPGAGPWQGRLVPEETLLDPLAGGDRKFIAMPLFVHIERSEAHRAMQTSHGNTVEFQDLFAILESYPDEPIFVGTAGEWATDRIGELLYTDRNNGFEEYETRALAALEVARREGDEAGLRRIAHRWPHTRAAGRANDARLELAMSTGDAALVVSIVLGELSNTWSPVDASERALQSLTRLADALGRSGNPELRAGLSRRLAELHPTTKVSLLDDPPEPLKDWAHKWALAPPPPAPPISFATAAPEMDRSYAESYVDVLRVPPSSPRDPWIQVLQGQDSLRGFRIDDPLLRSPWYKPHEEANERRRDRPRIAMTRGRVHQARGSSVKTLRASDGALLWSWDPDLPGSNVAVFTDHGVVVTVVRQDDTGPFLITALDAEHGVELWRLEFDGLYYRPGPVLGDGYCVVLPELDGKGQVFDLFTGAKLSSFPVDQMTLRSALGSWIEDGRFILPYFKRIGKPALNQVLAFDLMSGKQAWRLPLSAGPNSADLVQVLRYEDRTWLALVRPDQSGSGKLELRGLDVDRGRLARRPLASLPGIGKLVGLRPSSNIVLTQPWVFCTARDRMQIIAVQLDRGRAWTSSLEVTDWVSNASEMAQPIVGEDHVAWLIPQRMPQGGDRDLELRYLDLAKGQIQYRQVIESGTYKQGDLVSLGNYLLVCGQDRAELWK